MVKTRKSNIPRVLLQQWTLLIYIRAYLVRENFTLLRSPNGLHWARRIRRTYCVQSRVKTCDKIPFYTPISARQRNWYGPAAKLRVDECRLPHSRTALSLCHQERITMTVRSIKDRDTSTRTRASTQSLPVRLCVFLVPPNSQRTRDGREWPRWNA